MAIAQEHLRLGESELQKEKELNSGLITLGVSENALRIFLLDHLERFHENIHMYACVSLTILHQKH